MGKKHMKFSKMLKENAKKITVTKDGEEKTLAEMTQATIDNIVMVPHDGMIPVTVSEAAKNTVEGESSLTIATNYSDSVYSMYEFALKYENKQTLVLTLPADDVDEIFDGEEDSRLKEFLFGRSNLKMVLERVPEKRIQKLKNWAKEKDVKKVESYIIKFPELVLFCKEIKKHGPSNVKIFDLVVQVVRSPKSIRKLKKKNQKEFEETISKIVEDLSSTLKQLAIGCCHMNLDDRFFDDPHDYARIWAKFLDEDITKILNRMIFCTSDIDTMVSFNGEMRRIVEDNPKIKTV